MELKDLIVNLRIEIILVQLMLKLQIFNETFLCKKIYFNFLHIIYNLKNLESKFTFHVYIIYIRRYKITFFVHVTLIKIVQDSQERLSRYFNFKNSLKKREKQNMLRN